jgi:adenylate cyclase
MTKILVADDEKDLEVLIKQKFRQKIREQQYEFIFAVNGNDALEKIMQQPDVEIVLSDINMPLIKSVIVSAYGDMDNIRTAMNRGAFDFITKPINFEDLALTIEKTLKHVIQIKETLKAVKENNILKMYVDETVLNFMSGHEFETSLMANETVNATVAFIDICSFTSISESESPDTVVKLLNNYFDVIVKEVIAQNGHIDKFIGDAVMAVFNGDYHLDRALDACIAVRNKIDELPAVSENFSPKISIGINSGEMISGNIGSSSLRRLDYTVIGDAVNIAQRLQMIAGEGQIVISEAAYEKVKEFFNCRLMGEVSLKNKTAPINAYEVMD